MRVQLVAREEDHFPLRFAERIENGEPFLGHPFRDFGPESEIKHPVSVVEPQKNGRPEVGCQLVRVGISALFRGEAQFRREFDPELHRVVGIGRAGLEKGLQLRPARKHFGYFAQARNQCLCMLF